MASQRKAGKASKAGRLPRALRAMGGHQGPPYAPLGEAMRNVDSEGEIANGGEAALRLPHYSSDLRPPLTRSGCLAEEDAANANGHANGNGHHSSPPHSPLSRTFSSGSFHGENGGLLNPLDELAHFFEAQARSFLQFFFLSPPISALLPAPDLSSRHVTCPISQLEKRNPQAAAKAKEVRKRLATITLKARQRSQEAR